MVYFLDSSAIVKLYIEETGSAWVQEIVDVNPRTRLWISLIEGLKSPVL
ncbi:MAG: hypothetical protein ONB05_00770 [candidate division KSB1 bacterium]|nr:hypothetical protein [candidate division KSB1 bacterium]